ncbi:MAG: hypothetical protein CMC98_01860 [Flavobacteriales bacterium]|nr:hypothetical protein [Flavobacteriales bacterium]
MKNKPHYNIIRDHLMACSKSFEPSLDSYVDIDTYSKKIEDRACLFEEWHENLNELKGLVAAYDNHPKKIGWITNVSVDPKYIGKGIASKLLESCIDYFRRKKYSRVMLEVYANNLKAVELYKKHKFKIYDMKDEKLTLEVDLRERDYNKELNDTEDHKYAYNFDFDVMHPYYMKAALPYINTKGNCLELGSSKGHFTRRILEHYNDVTCVEASKKAIEEAQNLTNDFQISFDNNWRKKNIQFKHALFEDVKLDTNYDTIFLTHVLEHIDNPIQLLKLTNKWLSKDGILVLICPNANAPSRQIAVKMGLISHNSAVTPSEKSHGHNITYSLDTLEHDATSAGLKVISKSGIFFKALANFQWDKLLQTDIISQEYLDGCYSLGQQYPDLCSSIMLICKKG